MTCTSFVKTLREQRAERPVNESADQGLLLARTTFPLEESSRNLARGIRLFLVIDCQREKVFARVCSSAGYRGHEDHRICHFHNNGAIGLAGDRTRAQ